jgi:uncharacterized protein (DUF305 family)
MKQTNNVKFFAIAGVTVALIAGGAYIVSPYKTSVAKSQPAASASPDASVQNVVPAWSKTNGTASTTPAISPSATLRPASVSTNGTNNAVAQAKGDPDKTYMELMVPQIEQTAAAAKIVAAQAQHSELKQMASTLAKDAADEASKMRSWYKQWYNTNLPAPQSYPSPQGSAAPGTGAEIDAALMQQLVPEEEIPLMVSKMYLASGIHAELRTAANNIIQSRTNEMNQMQGWFRQWFSQAQPSK